MMRGEELTDAAGQLRSGDSDSARLLGVPRHVYAELLRALWRSAAATFRGDNGRSPASTAVIDG